MAPTATDCLHGLRRLWWVPLLTLVVGIGLGLWASSSARPNTVTTGYALFTFRIDDPGDDSAASARAAEADVAQTRLSGYVRIARSSEAVRALLASAGIEGGPTTSGPTGGFKDGSAEALIDVTQDAQGLIEIRVKNGERPQAVATSLVGDLSREVVQQVVALDAQQVTPSMRPDALAIEPLAKVEPASPLMRMALPILLLLTLGLGIVYLIVWRRGRIYGRRDIEERVGARVLGDLRGRDEDAPAIALALAKGRKASTRALLVPIRRPRNDLAPRTGVSEAVAAAGRELGLGVTLRSASQESPQDSTVLAGAWPEQTATTPNRGSTLNLIDAAGGLTPDSLREAASVDIVALIVEYGHATYRDMRAAGETLAEVTDAEIAVVGIYSSTTY